jgi:hypothetical protein
MFQTWVLFPSSDGESKKRIYVGFEVLTVMIMKSINLWDAMPYNTIEGHQYFGELYCLHLQGQGVN